MDLIYKCADYYNNIKNDFFDGYIITYGIYNKNNCKTIILYDYDSLFWLLYIFFCSLFQYNFLENRCIKKIDYKENKIEELLHFGVYYTSNNKYGFINKITENEWVYKNKILFIVINNAINMIKYFHLFHRSIKDNIVYTYEELINIFSALFNININDTIENITVFFMDKCEENTFKKEDIVNIYD